MSPNSCHGLAVYSVGSPCFMVDLIPPAGNGFAARDDGANREDPIGAGIEGLEWLVDAPKSSGVVIGGDGFPLRFWCVDPRALRCTRLGFRSRPIETPSGVLVTARRRGRLPG